MEKQKPIEKKLSDKDRLRLLAEMRIEHYKSAKKNQDFSHSIIGEQLYSKQSHFIFELLQNAEDEGASKVRISFNEEMFVFQHNGRPFDISDIEAITSFGNNERKKLKPNAIGRFGIGFKSVFSITERPEIKSGNFHFAISNYIVPNLIDSENSKETIITLPFKRLKEKQIIASIEKTINELDSLYLLFLNNIKIIEITNNINNNHNRSINLKKKSLKGSDFKIYSIDEGENQKDFLLFENTALIEKKKLPIKIAFTITVKGNKLEFNQIESSPLFAFFATDKQTNLPFYVHAPFLTTPARDNIIENESRNEKLFSALTDLMIKAIDLLKNNHMIDIKTWLVFPCNISLKKNEIYKIFYDSFSQYLSKEKTMILPTDNGTFSHVNNAIKAKDPNIQKLVSQRDTKKYFGRTNWVTLKLNTNTFKIIDELLEHKFKVPTIGIVELCERLDDSFFAKQTDNWLIEFYGYIGDEKKLWRTSDKYNKVGPLRNKAFIRTSKNQMVKPFDSQGNSTIYLPSEGTSNYILVKSIFLEDKESKKLFKSLNITKPDLIAEVIEHVIPKIENSTAVYKGIKEDILKIFRAIRKADLDEERKIIKKLVGIAWLPGKNNLSKKASLYKPDEIYFPSRDLIKFLSKSPTANFLDPFLFVDHKSKQNAKGILEDVGVFFRPRKFFKLDNTIIFEGNNSLNQNYWNRDNIELEGLKEYLRKTIDKKSSIYLWNLLARYTENWKQIDFADTMFTQQLRDAKWLFNKFGQRLKPADITPLELDEAYESSDTLINALNFKADEIKDFELEHGGRFLSNDEFQMLKDEIQLMKKEIERLRNQYEPENDDDLEDELPDIQSIESTELTSDESSFNDNVPDDYQIDDYNAAMDSGKASISSTLVSTLPTRRQIRVGIRGEEFVMKLLKNIYKNDNTIEIENLNENDKLGVGCDLILRKNGVAKTLIEVKSTEGGYENKFKISEKQWLTAIKSHLDNSEPEYHIYCVYYAGGTNLQHIVIKDPIEWMLKKKLKFVEQWFNVLIKR